MHFRETSIEGLYVVEPVMHGDERGFFYEQFQAVEFQSHGLVAQYLQDNCSSSQRYTLRGLHYQRAPYAQTKLVRAVAGRILDVAVDVRPASPTFGKHYAVELSDTNHLALYVPKGFAHGFLALSDRAVVTYKCDALWDSASEGGIAYNDPALGIAWPLDGAVPILSVKDQQHPTLQKALEEGLL